MEANENLEDKKKLKVRTLTDFPAEEDEFGPHQSLAETISNLIKNEDGNKAIALLGSWGSGKSTVITLLEKEFSKDNTFLFLFDSWSHEGDPLRRSFLESFITKLAERKWLIKDEWEEDIEEISRRKETTTTKSKPSLTFEGKIYALAFILMPIGLALISKNGLSCEYFRGLLLSTSPIILAFIFYLTWRPTWNPFLNLFWSKKNWFEHNKKHSKNSVFSIIQKTELETVQTTTARTPDPTTIEFKRVFEDAVSKALENNDKKLVVVIDNLDRVRPEVAQRIWTTMRVFFDVLQDKQEIIKRFWLIVPFDEGAFENVWGSKEQVKKSFLDKTFQLKFHVSPPVLSDWRDFLIKRLEYAFPDQDPKVFHITYRMYLLSESSNTPREIKIFINDISEIYRQWEDKIPFNIQAAYILFKNKEHNKKPEETIINGTFVDEKIVALLREPDWQKYIASLYYNVDSEKAIQILIRPRIERAFSRGESRLIENIKTVPAFDDVCERVVDEGHVTWVDEEPAVIGLSAKVMHELNVTETASINRLWSILISSISSEIRWRGLNTNVSKGIINILNRVTANEMDDKIKFILSGLTNLKVKITESDDQEKTISIPEEWSKQSGKSISPLLSAILEKGFENIVSTNFYVPGNATEYLAILRSMRANLPNDEVLRYFRSQVSEDKIVSELVKDCNEGSLVSPSNHIFDILIQTEIKKWTVLVNAIGARLAPNVALKSHEIDGLLYALSVLSYNKRDTEASSKLEQLVTAGHIPHHLYAANSEKNHRAVGLCILAILKFNFQGTNANNAGNSAAGLNIYNPIVDNPEKNEQIVGHLADLVFELAQVQFIIEKVSDAKSKKLAVSVIDYIIENYEFYEILPPKQLINNEENLNKALSLDGYDQLIDSYVKNTDLLQVTMSQGYTTKLEGLYFAILQVEENNDNFINYVVKGLKENVSKEEWVLILKDESRTLAIVNLIIKNNNEPNLGRNFYQALREHIKLIRTADARVEDYRDEWSQIVKAMDPAFYDTFFKDVVSELNSKNDQTIGEVLNLYMKELYDTGAISEKADDFFRSSILNALEREDVSEVLPITNLFKNYSSLLNNVDKKIIRTIKSSVSSIIKDLNKKDNPEEYKDLLDCYTDIFETLK